jgi:predicted amidohydrolase
MPFKPPSNAGPSDSHARVLIQISEQFAAVGGELRAGDVITHCFDGQFHVAGSWAIVANVAGDPYWR